MKNEVFLKITESMPMKVIEINGEPYLERYFAGYTEDGGQWWYHHFLRNDSERHLHSHPWEGSAMILCGHYTEQSRGPNSNHNDAQHDHIRTYRIGHHNQIFPETLHRIVEVAKNTWTLIYVKAGRLPEWFFIDDDGNKKFMKSSPENWHEGFQPR